MSDFSDRRMAPYLDTANGDHALAERLYRRNARLAAGFMEAESHFEVAFRNAINRKMQERHRKRGQHGHWLDDPDGELGRDLRSGPQAKPNHKQPYADIARAKAQLTRRRIPETDQSNHLVAALPLGFWSQLVGKRHTRLWPDLAGAFPYAPSRGRRIVADPVQRIHTMRNRAGHHHRLPDTDVRAAYESILAVAGFIDPALQRWIDDGSSVPGLLAA
ncbi:MAG: hypothetical protein LBM66_05100 [Bifidobacteriaceae bacterium]|jgi:hypothetical protein|nr:hypothetical protein [Bifidobacteriaceae bacterium]